MSQTAPQEIFHPLISKGQCIEPAFDLKTSGVDFGSGIACLHQKSSLAPKRRAAAPYTAGKRLRNDADYKKLYVGEVEEDVDAYRVRKRQKATVNTSISNQVVERFQLRYRHLDLFFGASVHRPPLFIYDTSDIGNPRMKALTAAMDAFCLAQLATSYNDESLAATSRILYGRAITLLNDRISSLATQGEYLVSEEQLDNIVGAICGLIACAWFVCIGAAQYDCIKHLQGLNRVIELYGCAPGLSRAVSDRFCAHWQRRALGDSFLPGRSLPDSIRKGVAGNNDDEFFRKSAVRVRRSCVRGSRATLGAGADSAVVKTLRLITC